MFPMELDIVTATVFVVALLVLALVPLINFRLLSYHHWKNGPDALPPMAPTTCRDITNLTVEGTIHRYFLDMASELGLVFRIPQEHTFEHHFICCDPGLARLVLDGDSAHNIPAGEKRNEVKLIDKLTMNTPSILTKLTYGEG